MSVRTLGAALLCMAILTGCGTTSGVRRDAELTKEASAAQTAYQAGSLAKAETLYAQAVQRAEVMDDRDEIARNAYNRGATLMAMGKTNDAQTALNMALAVSGRVGEIAAQADLLKATAARRAGDDAAALVLAQAAMGALGPAGSESAKAEIALFMADVYLGQGRVDAAGAQFQSADKWIGKDAALSLRASRERIGGMLALARHNAAEAASRFDAEAALRKADGNYREMALALTAAGDAHERNHAGAEASDRFCRAARSLFASGETEAAGELAQRARMLAERSGNRALVDELDSLSGEMSRGSGGKSGL